MKKSSLIVLLITAGASSLVQAQSSAPDNSTANLRQLSLPPALANPPAAPPTATPTPAAPASADPATAFTDAVTAYGQGNYARAGELFAVAEKKSVSAPLEYNFGNASYEAHDYGAAILHYLRALSLDPRDPDAHQNLALARKAANISPPDETQLSHFSALLTKNTWTWIAAIAGWAAVYLAFLPRLFRWRGAVPWLLCAVSVALAAAAGVGLWGAQQHAHDGVVLHADTPLNLSPTTNSPAIIMLQPGEVAQAVEQHGRYYKIRTASGQLGWVEAEKFSPVWN